MNKINQNVDEIFNNDNIFIQIKIIWIVDKYFI
jgi:hypothetical protein